MNIELAVFAICVLLVILLSYQIYNDRKKGKSWKEIAEDRAEGMDFTGLFRRRRSRQKDNDDDSHEPAGSDGPDADFD